MNWLRQTNRLLLFRTVKQDILKNGLHNLVYKNINITSTKVVTLHFPITFYNPVRNKSKKQKYDSDDEEDEYNDDSLSKDSKLVKFHTTSMRTDVILKSALGVARNKIEQMFYESKIRVNGKKILKKSAPVKAGDEVDVIKMVSPKNSDHLYVARVIILNVSPSEEDITVTARRFKNLLIENYETDPHKSSGEMDTN